MEHPVEYPDRKIWEPLPTIEERMALGKKQREKTPREAHASFKPGKDRSDPVQLLIESSVGRLQDLIPIRYGRMLTSAFAFLRGSAVVMAEDLSRTPCSDIYVQCCGDCHMMNFGGYGTPERNQVFDINDFDETLPAPFEWDLKRLAASIVVGGRYREFSDKINKKAALIAAKTYTDRMREFSRMRQLDIWYNRIDEATVVELFKKDREFVQRVKEISAKARLHTHDFLFPKITSEKNGRWSITDDPPLIYHPPDVEKMIQSAHGFFDEYARSLTDDRRALLKRFRLEDASLKVVGVGSVGTHCLIGLFVQSDKDAMILQFKEGNASVLEKYAGKSKYSNHAERIVNGQRLMQTVSDIFLGWTKTTTGIDFYIRQLRDMKSSATVEHFTPELLNDYSYLCGWALAKSHAKAGRAPEISGYIGRSMEFAEAISDFAVLYANQTNSDFAALQKAEKDKRITVVHGK